MPCEGECLQANSFLQAGITDHAPGHVVHQLMAGLVVGGSKVLGGHGKSNCIGKALTKRAGGDLDAITLDLRVTGGERVEVGGMIGLELVVGHALDADEVQEEVLPETRVA